jgi:hypothetical protein
MPQVQSSALPGTCSRVTAEGRFQGRVAPDPRCRGTTSAFEAEVGEVRAHALSRLLEGGRGPEKRPSFKKEEGGEERW